MSKKSILVVALASAIVVMLAVMFGWPDPDPRVDAAQAAPPEPRHPSAQPQLEQEVRGEARSPSTEADVRFRVLDELQAPVEGAELLIANVSARWDRKGVIGVLGVSDPFGHLEAPYTRIEQAPPDSLTFYHDDYSAQPLESPVARDRENVITLRRGHRLSVRCEDLSGRPVVGAKILASLRPLPPADEVRNADIRVAGPVAHPDEAIHATQSDEAGLGAIDGLARGRYRVRATAEGRDVIERHTSAASVPGPELLIRFADVVCGRVRVVGDEVLTFTGGGDGRLSLGMLGHHELGRLRMELQAAHPKDLVFLGLNSDPQGRPAAMDVHVLLRDHGVRHLRVALMPFRDGCSETLLDLVDEPVDGVPCVPTRITILDSQGSPVDSTDLYLEHSLDGHRFQIPITSGAERCLPPGEYELMARDEHLEASLDPRSVVVSAENPKHEISLLGEVMRYRFRLVDEDGKDIPNVFLQIEAQGKNQVMSTGIARALDFWLPSGRVTIKAQASGRQATDWTGIVGRAPYEPDGEITIVLPRD